MSTLRIIGRTLLAAIFILGGINKLPNPGSIVGYTTAKLSAIGDFVPPTLLTPQAVLVMLYIAAIGETLGGLLVVTGFERIGAIILIAFLAVITPIMHNPVGANGSLDQMEMSQVLKNAALAGALMVLASSTHAGRSAGKRKPE